jgi:hypothetical protein
MYINDEGNTKEISAFFIRLFIVLGAFAKFLKTAISFVMSVCPSVRMEHLRSHSTDYDKT